jgi:hypothetical protein
MIMKETSRHIIEQSILEVIDPYFGLQAQLAMKCVREIMDELTRLGLLQGTK